MVMAKAALEPQGKWDALRDDLLAMYERESEPTRRRHRGTGRVPDDDRTKSG